MTKWQAIAFGLLFAVAGFGLMYWSTRDYAAAKTLLAKGKILHARVSGMQPVRGNKGGTTYALVISFKDGEKDVTFTENHSSSSPSYSIGDAVDVVYDASRPSDTRINTFWGLYLGVVMTSLIGVLFAAVGLYMIFYSVSSTPTDSSYPPVNQPLV